MLLYSSQTRTRADILEFASMIGIPTNIENDAAGGVFLNDLAVV